MADLGDDGLQDVALTIAARWDELPGHFGDRWPAMVGTFAGLVQRLRGDQRDRAAAVYDLGLLLRGHPTMAPLLRHKSAPTRSAYSGPPQRHGGAPTWSEAIAALQERLDEVLAERHTEVFAPPSLPIGGRDIISVRLTRTPLVASVASQVVLAGAPTTFVVRLHAPGELVRVDGPLEHTIAVTPKDDGEAAVFFLTGLVASTAYLAIDVLHSGVVVASVPVKVAVLPASSGSVPAHRAGRRAAIVKAVGLSPADVELRVLLDDAGPRPRLRFVVHSPDGRSGYHHYPAGEVVLDGTPREYQQRLFRRLERAHGAGSAWHQHAVGEQLYRDLVPERLQQILRQLSRARSMQITSDEPWIPWELVRPFEHDGGTTAIDDDHWCVRFELTRWLPGTVGPPSQVRISSYVILDADDRTLPSVAPEHRQLNRMFRNVGVDDLSPKASDAASVAHLLDTAGGHVGLWHVSGHGDALGLRLVDGSRLYPDEIAGPREVALRRRRPVAFMNACRSAQQELAWGGLGGWAETWARRCGAVFVGPQWGVTDEVAAYIATTFYARLLEGYTVGAAMTIAREACRRRWPDDPSWLAYSVYAHPSTTVTFGP